MRLYNKRREPTAPHPGFNSEFAEDFFEIENTRLAVEIAGGPISYQLMQSLEADEQTK